MGHRILTRPDERADDREVHVAALAPGPAAFFMNSIAAAAPSFSVSAAQAFVQNEDDIQRVISIGEADGALIVPSDPFTHDHATLIASLATKNRLPGISSTARNDAKRRTEADARSNGPKQFFVRIGDLLVFVLAVLGSVLRQMSLLHHVAKQLRIGAVGDAQ
jgi:hypothetical protein